MICPYCNQTMEKGYISFDGRRRPVWDSLENVKQVPLAKFKIVSALTSYNLKAFYSESCKKIVMDLENTEIPGN